MAVALRSSTESETFDLAGTSASTIESTIKSAFAEPLDLKDMIRLTFVTGAGKLGRSRYDENAARILTSTLRDLGYEEDRGASCVVECAGSFKSQHDTGKNLKTIVVFPKINLLTEAMDNLQLGQDKGPSILEVGSPEQLIAMASMNTFERMLDRECPSWTQKKACIAAIGEVKEIVQSLDNKLLHGTPLTDSEQEFYDTCDLTSLEQKENYVKSQMSKQVDDGKIISLEKKRLIAQVSEKLDNIGKEIKESAGKPKKLQKLQTQQQKLEERKEKLDDIRPCSPPPLKHQSSIDKLRKELAPLLKMEKEAKGRLLTIKETAAMTRKEEIEDEIVMMEANSMGWFEDDESFVLRVEASRAQGKKVVAKKVVKKAGGGGSGTNSKKPINWVVPGKKTASRPAAKKKASNTNAFAAMMMDSDSDSD